MTTIIGVEYEDGCTLMADSRTTDSEGRIYSHPTITKLNRRGDFIIGGSGEVSPCDITQHIWMPPRLTAADKKDVYHFMIKKAMPSLRKCLKDNGYNFDETQEKGDGSRFQGSAPARPPDGREPASREAACRAAPTLFDLI